MTQTDATRVETKEVSCDGGTGSLGHPRVFLNMGREDNVVCPYCGKKFVVVEGKKTGSH
jgi:uncharacterized Zn-finger protein